MSDASVDLSLTPAESMRFKARRKMADTTKGKENFKIPNLPSVNAKTKQIKIRTVAERKTDLLSRWGPDNCNSLGFKNREVLDQQGNNAAYMGNASSNNSDNTSSKLAKFKYIGGRDIREDNQEEDTISLGESAKMTQAKMKLNMAMHEGGNSDYTDHDNADHEHGSQNSEHDEETSNSGTRYTDVSTAQSNIAEQAEIAERKELEEMKQQVGEDGGTEVVLKFILEKLTMLQIGVKEIKVEQQNINMRINALGEAEQKLKRANNYCINELQEVVSNNFKIIQTTIKHDQEIGSMKTAIQACETKLQKGLMSINGIKKEEGENLRQVVEDFLKDKMKIPHNIMIKMAYRLSKYKIAFQLNDPNTIGLIFQHAKNLKGLKNEDQRFYQLDEMLPDHQYETKQRVRDIKKENSRMPFTYQATLSTEKGKLYVGEDEDRKMVTEEVGPEPAKNYLLMHKLEEDVLENLQVIQGQTKVKEKSKFIAYAAVVGSVSNVQLIYKKLKCEHQMATPCYRRIQNFRDRTL